MTKEIRSWSGQLPVMKTYSALTGRLERICADKPGTGGACDLVDERYAWDKAGNLHTRQKETRYVETFQYDVLNRLTHAYASAGGDADQLTHWAQYDRLGNTCARLSDAVQHGTAFDYGGRAGCGVETPNGGGGSGDVGAHQVSRVYSGPLAGTYHYDNRGNQVLRDVAGSTKDRRIRYSADDRPYEISLGSEAAPSQRARFWYGPDGQRYKREDLGGKRTLYLGNVEVVIQGGQTTMRRMIGGSLLQLVANGVNDNRYLFHDHLGSLVKTTDALGNVVDALDYMPNGTRRNTANPQQPVENSPAATPRGFTGHEHVDGFDVIHMNGRIYDPTLGRFLQPDPVVQAPMGAQGWNAYTYVFNNPLAYTDPSGMISLRQVLGIVFAAVYAYFTWDLTGATAVYAAMIGGAITGAITTGTWRGAITGAFTGALTAGIGVAANTYQWGDLARIGAQAVSGGIVESLSGGNFGNGFFAAGLTASFMPHVGHRDAAVRSIKGALIGGTISKATGGKFANGAISGAIQAAMTGARRSGEKSSNDGNLPTEFDSEVGSRAAAEGQAAVNAFAKPDGYDSPDEVARMLDDTLPGVAKKWNTEIGARIFQWGGKFFAGDIVSDGAICRSGYRCTVNVSLSNLHGEYGRGFLYGDYHTHPSSSLPGFSWQDFYSSPWPSPSGYVSYLSQHHVGGQRLIAFDWDRHRSWSSVGDAYNRGLYRVVRRGR